MHYFRSVHSAVHAAIAALCWWTFQNMEWLQSIFEAYRHLAIPVVLGGLALLFRTSDALSNIILGKIPLLSALLRRLLSGRHFVEGDWPLAVVDMDNRQLLYFGFLRIDFQGGQIHVEGDDWNVDGTHAHAFRSVQSLYKDHTLQYWYEQGASLHRPDMRGYTEIYFFPVNALAERHAGKFLDPKHTSDIRFYAEKQPYRLMSVRAPTKDQKLEAARKFWGELQPKISHLQTRDISADFE
jgi:hypothetical protein